VAKRSSRSVLKREIIELDDEEGEEQEDQLCEHLEWSAAQSLVQMNSSKQEKQRRAGNSPATVAAPISASGKSHFQGLLSATIPCYISRENITSFVQTKDLLFIKS